MNVLSLFDGCSGGQQALNRIGIVPDKYFASEIDKYAIQVTMANYPNTIQLGSVVNVDVSTLPKIDLLCGGSPCQSFSFAGKRKGMSTKDNQEIYTLEHYLQLKSEGFEFEGQSYLFWEYMRIRFAYKNRFNVFYTLLGLVFKPKRRETMDNKETKSEFDIDKVIKKRPKIRHDFSDMKQTTNCLHDGDERIYYGNGFYYKKCAKCGEDI